MISLLKKNFKYVLMVLGFCIAVYLSYFCENPFATETSITFDQDKPVLIIDSGHGGLDGGAVSEDGFLESEATLEIGKKTKAICDFFGVPNIMTRYDENSLDFDEDKSIGENKVSDTRARVELVNSYDNAILASIHLNKFTDERSSGAQVFYNDSAQEFANILQKYIKKLDNNNTREALIVPKSIYITNNANCPAVIYECGFLSNNNELKLLKNERYQTKLALNLVLAFLEHTSEVQNL